MSTRTRIAELEAKESGSFEFRNRAPRRYWLLARPAPEVDPVEAHSRPVAWDEGELIKLRREAKNVKKRD